MLSHPTLRIGDHHWLLPLQRAPGGLHRQWCLRHKDCPARDRCRERCQCAYGQRVAGRSKWRPGLMASSHPGSRLADGVAGGAAGWALDRLSLMLIYRSFAVLHAGRAGSCDADQSRTQRVESRSDVFIGHLGHHIPRCGAAQAAKEWPTCTRSHGGIAAAAATGGSSCAVMFVSPSSRAFEKTGRDSVSECDMPQTLRLSNARKTCRLVHDPYRSLTSQRGLIHGSWLERASDCLPRMWSAAFSPVMIEGLFRLP